MNTVLKDLVGHNTWATRTLLAFCATLSDEQLRWTTLGAYGDVLTTMEHLVESEAHYYRHLTGQEIPSHSGRHPGLLLLEVQSWADVISPYWLAFLDAETDVDQIFVATSDSGRRAHIALGVALAQVFNHANVHREQICSILTVHGVEPPEIDAWTYALATGRAVLDGQSR